jgi:hypothetical protein
MWDDHAGLPPFRRCEADQFGLTDADVRRLLGHGVLVRLAHGLIAGYRRPELAEDEVHRLALRAQAMQRRYPDAAAGMQTAAALHRLWLVGPQGPVRLLRTRGYPRRKPDVVVETVALPAEDITVVEGVVTTSLERTTIDLLPRLAGGEALALADSALRAGAKPAELARLASEFGYFSDSFVVRVLNEANPLSQSALESMSRWLFLIAGVPKPELQVLLGDDVGPFALVDFLWREQGVVGEADGLLKYDEDLRDGRPDNADVRQLGKLDVLREEKLRQERLEQMGLIVVRWGWDGVVNESARTVSRVRSALARGSSVNRRRFNAI